MALGTKLGTAVAVVAIGGAGLWGWQHSKKDDQQPEVTVVTPPGDQHLTAATGTTLAPEPIRTEPPPDPLVTEPLASTPPGESSGALASPLPPMGVQEASERSFRARPEQHEEVPTLSNAPSIAETLAPRLDPPPALTEPPAVVSLSESTPPAPKAEPIALAAEKAPASQPAVLKPVQHVIQSGETYTALAEKYFGSAKYVGLIAKANPGKDPRRLLVGSKINIPPAPKEVAATKPELKQSAPTGSAKLARIPDETASAIPAERAYKVQPGETWNDIAQRFLGDQKRWPELYELNKDRVATNPASLRSGSVIELPPGVKLSTRPS